VELLTKKLSIDR